MKITKIERQKKNVERYSLYVDDEFWMGVHENVLIQYGLYKAQPVNKETLEQIARSEYLQSVYLKAIQFLSYGLKSIYEMREYLEKYLSDRAKEENRELNELDFDNIEQTIERLIEQNYLNDLIYSQSYVRTHATINRKGPQVLRRELHKKGIANHQIDEGLLEYSNELVLENAKELLEKYIRIKKKQYPFKKLIEKSKEMLMQKGFNREIIQEVMSQFAFEEETTFEDELLEKEASKQLRKWRRKYDGFTLKQKIIESLMRKGFKYDEIQQWLMDHEEELE